MTKRKAWLPRTFASVAVQPRSGSTPTGRRSALRAGGRSWPPAVVPGLHAGALPGEDHVAHRQSAVDLGVQVRRGGPSLGMPFSSAGASRSNSFWTTTTRYCGCRALVELGEKSLQVVVGLVARAVPVRTKSGSAVGPPRATSWRPTRSGLSWRISSARPSARSGEVVGGDCREDLPVRGDELPGLWRRSPGRGRRRDRGCGSSRRRPCLCRVGLSVAMALCGRRGGRRVRRQSATARNQAAIAQQSTIAARGMIWK